MSSPAPKLGDTPPAHAVQYPLQQHETFPRPPTSTRRPLRRTSTATSTTSFQGESRDTPELGRNAISTLVQPPLARTGLLPSSNPPGSFKTPTAKDIPPVTLTNITHVESKAFQSYLSQVGSLHEAFRKAREVDPSISQCHDKESKDAATIGKDLGADSTSSRKPTHSRSGSFSSTLTMSSNVGESRRRPNAQRRGQSVAPLSMIPSVYFEEDFHLENPRTFDIVSEQSQVIRSQEKGPEAVPSSRKALATNAILQEKLSWYMDTVEVHLISSISTASKSFFSALGSMRELHSEAAESVRRIQRLRRDLARLDQDVALGGLHIASLKQRKENVRRLGEAIAQLRDVVSSVTRCEMMIDKGEIQTAMDELDQVEKLISGDPSCNEAENQMYRRRDLGSLHALHGASEDLQRLRSRIGKAHELRFLDALLGDLRSHSEAISPDSTLQRWSSSFVRNRGDRKAPAAFPAYMTFDSGFRSQLRVELNGLARARYTGVAAAALKAQVLKEMKGLIRKHLPSSSDDDRESVMSASTIGGRPMDAKEKSSILARNLRAMDANDAQSMFTRIYTSISESLRRLGVQVKVLLDVTSGIASPPNTAGMRSPIQSPSFNGVDASVNSRLIPPIGTQEDVQQALDMSSLLGEAVDFIHQQITKVLKVRTEQVVYLPLRDFLRYFSLNRLFADECEAISGRSGNAIKSVVDSQIKDYVNQFNDSQRSRIVQVMDVDQWDAKDFGQAENKTLARILESGTRDDTSWVQDSMIWLLETETGGQEHVNGKLTNGYDLSQGRDRTRSAVIDEQKYTLSESVLAMIHTIEKFQHLAAGIPSVCPEIATGLLDTLKTFNSRSAQLILGAGATRSAGLKNITTKHLALASQALSFIVALIPYVREFFRRHLSVTGSIMADFDKVKRAFQEHQNGIHEKLVDIMSSRASLHVSSMKKIDWEEAARNKSRSGSDYMETLTKETGTLFKVLAKHLPEPTIMMIMGPVFSSYKDQLSTAFRGVPLGSEAAKDRLLADAQLFQGRISKIHGSGDIGDHLVDLVAAKPVMSGDGKTSSTTREILSNSDAQPKNEPKPS